MTPETPPSATQQSSSQGGSSLQTGESLSQSKTARIPRGTRSSPRRQDSRRPEEARDSQHPPSQTQKAQAIRASSAQRRLEDSSESSTNGSKQRQRVDQKPEQRRSAMLTRYLWPMMLCRVGFVHAHSRWESEWRATLCE